MLIYYTRVNDVINSTGTPWNRLNKIRISNFKSIALICILIIFKTNIIQMHSRKKTFVCFFLSVQNDSNFSVTHRKNFCSERHFKLKFYFDFDSSTFYYLACQINTCHPRKDLGIIQNQQNIRVLF